MASAEHAEGAAIPAMRAALIWALIAISSISEAISSISFTEGGDVLNQPGHMTDRAGQFRAGFRVLIQGADHE